MGWHKGAVCGGRNHVLLLPGNQIAGAIIYREDCSLAGYEPHFSALAVTVAEVLSVPTEFHVMLR